MKTRRCFAIVLAICILFNLIPTNIAFAGTHEHKAVMCGMPYTYYEKQDANNHVKVYHASDDLCSCGAVMTAGKETRTSEAHSFDSNGYCSVCGYQKTHEHVAIRTQQPKISYEKNDSSTHIKVYRAGNETCSCGAVVVEGKTTRTAESHSFDSNGYCSVCGYQKPHEHVAIRTQQPKISYEQNNSSTHIKVYRAGNETCSCGAVVVEGKTTRTEESHSFDSNGYCSVCGYQKPHEHVAIRSEAPQTNYEQNNSSTHIKVYRTSNETCSCGAVVVEGKTTRTEESHSFDSNEYCSVCGYQKPHEHVAIRSEAPQISYEQNNSSTHIKVYRAGNETCGCGAIVVEGKTTRTEESHSFDSNEYCSVCGYQKPHEHKAIYTEMPWSNYYLLDSDYHLKEYHAGNEICSCGETLVIGESTNITEHHNFDSNGYCNDCGYQQIHIHSAIKCVNPNIWYEPWDASVHTKYMYEGDKVCSCGSFVEKGKTVHVSENHVFDDNGYCTACGYQKLHEHTVSTYEPESTIYSIRDENFHQVTITEGIGICSCGEIVTVGAVRTKPEEHSFDVDNKCNKCGYIRQHVHEASMNGIAKTTYEKKDDKNHTRIFTAGGTLCSCGEVLTEGTTTKTDEAHTFLNDVCTKCGYTKEHKHEGSHTSVETRIEYVDLNYHNRITITTTYCDCGIVMKAVENKVKERHTLDCGCKENRNHLIHREAKHQPDKISYKDITATTHTKVTVVADVLCDIGGEVLQRGGTSQKVENHTLKDGVCSACGYKSGEHVHHSSVEQKRALSYGACSQSKHITCVVTSNVYCDECGKLMKSGSTDYFTENHTYDSNNVCKYCGLEKNTVKQTSLDEYWHQVVFGEFSDDVSVEGTMTEIGLSFVPIVGEAMDVRDFVGSITNYESFIDVAINAIGFIPIIGSFLKYGDEIFGGLKYSDEISELLTHLDDAEYIMKHQDEYLALMKNSDEFKAVFKQVGNGQNIIQNADEISDIVKNSDSITIIYKNGAKYTSGVKLDDASNLIRSGERLADGTMKYSDETLELIRYEEKLTDIPNVKVEEFDEMIDSVMSQNVEKYVKPDSYVVTTRASTAYDPYSSFNSFKYYNGRAGDNMEWHHIVEQEGSGFGKELVQSADNIVALDKETHHIVTAFYNTTYQGTGMTVREYIKSQEWTFEEEYQFGVQVLEHLGVIVR